MKFHATLILLLMPLAVGAQTVTFRSGEHADFSRLVLDIPDGAEWTLERTSEDYVLSLGEGVTFDTSAAFDRIPRDRIAALEVPQGTGDLIIKLGCDCHATAFLFEEGKLVVDVVDGPAPSGSPFETPQHTGSDNRLQVGTTLPLLSGMPDQVADAELLFSVPEPAPVNGGPSLEGLASDLSRAVAAGLLDAPEVLPAEVVPEQPPADPVPTSTEGEADSPGVNFITADAETTRPSPRELSRSGHVCRSDADVDFVGWAPSGDYSRDLGALRARIVDGAGNVDEAAVQALARAYLHYGFGAEARRTLAISTSDSTESRFLGLLADLVDGRNVPPGSLSDQAGCLGAIALWSALAAGTLSDRSAAERTSVETALRILPSGPRQAIAPRVAAMFLTVGQSGTAADLLELAPDQAKRSEDVVQLRSDIAAVTANAEAARTELLTAISDGTRTGAGTMIRLIDATIESGQPVEGWMIETVAALRFEQRDGPMAGPLALAEIRALTASDAFDAATERLADNETPISDSERRDLSDAVALAIADRADDARFLDFAFADEPLTVSAIGSNAVARRLLVLGFPEVALELVDGPAEAEAMRDRRILRAEALRALGQEAEAERVLAGIVEAETAMSEEEVNNSWRSGDWEAVRNGGDPLLAEAATALTADPVVVSAESLAEREALIDSAEEARALAEALLARFPSPNSLTVNP
jgi:hypothetical protein